MILEGETQRLQNVVKNQKRSSTVGRKRMSRKRGARDPNDKRVVPVEVFD